MKIVNILLVVLIALLSIAAGLAKVMQSPQEAEFLQGFGLSTTLIIVFGLVQIAGGAGLALPKTRIVGGVLAALGFAVSTVLVFIGGNLAFGLFSLLPIVLVGVVIHQSVKAKESKV